MKWRVDYYEVDTHKPLRLSQKGLGERAAKFIVEQTTIKETTIYAVAKPMGPAKQVREPT
jgi:hypothetical protein